jgi:hypothetical protein
MDAPLLWPRNDIFTECCRRAPAIQSPSPRRRASIVYLEGFEFPCLGFYMHINHSWPGTDARAGAHRWTRRYDVYLHAA